MDSPQSTPGPKAPLPTPRRILLFRADAIGDHILSSGLIPLIRAKWPKAELTVLCPALVQDLFRPCGLIDHLITFHPSRLRDWRSRLRLGWLLRHRYDLAVNTVFSRDLVVDRLARSIRAHRTFGFKGDTCNQGFRHLRKHDAAYSDLVQVPDLPLHALDRLNVLAKALGLSGEVQPTVWFSENDRAFGKEVFTTNSLNTETTLACFHGAGTAIRKYDGFAEAIGGFLQKHPARVVFLGAPGDRPSGEKILAALPGSGHLNLCGDTTLGQAASILAQCKLAIGSESGLAHTCWALGIPHVVLEGGGHFGTFLPRSPLTTTACLPMDCFGCNWDCRFPRPHCVQDLPPRLLEAALTEAWNQAQPPAHPRIFYPDPSPAPLGHASNPLSLPGGIQADWMPLPMPEDASNRA